MTKQELNALHLSLIIAGFIIIIYFNQIRNEISWGLLRLMVISLNKSFGDVATDSRINNPALFVGRR